MTRRLLLGYLGVTLFVLLALEVPYSRLDQVRAVVLARHPEALPAGIDSRYPAFP